MQRMFRAFAEQTKSDLRALAACIRGSRQTLTPEAVGRIAVPTMISVGTNDPVAGEPHGLAALIPGAVAFDIQGRDHNLAVGRPQPQGRGAGVPRAETVTGRRHLYPGASGQSLVATAYQASQGGPGERPPVLLLHGGGQTRHAFTGGRASSRRRRLCRRHARSAGAWRQPMVGGGRLRLRRFRSRCGERRPRHGGGGGAPARRGGRIAGRHRCAAGPARSTPMHSPGWCWWT